MNRVALSIRNVSLSACRLRTIQPPVVVSGVGGKYASAIYCAAVKSNILDNVINEMSLVEGEYAKNQALRHQLCDPFVRISEKKKQAASTADRLKCGAVTKKFFEVVADNGRMDSLDEIFGAFKQIVAAHRGELFCEVTTAKPMDASMKDSLEKVLQNFSKTGKKMRITYKTDPSLIAGMTVSVGNQLLDMSAASKIELYKEVMEGAL